MTPAGVERRFCAPFRARKCCREMLQFIPDLRHADAESRLLRSCREHIEGISSRLAAAGFTAHLSTDLDELAAVAREWHQAGQLRAVVACGGDGTAALVRNHLPLEIPLLALPLGTENLLSRYLSQTAEPEDVCQTIERGVVIGLDLGKAGEQHFLMMISAGFDAEVIRRLHHGRRGHITRLSYVWPTLETIRSYAYPELQLYCHQAEASPVESGRCRWLFGFNLPLYACGWRLAPDAVGTDCQLDVCTFGRGSLASGIQYLWHVMWGSHLRLADSKLRRSSHFRVEAADGAQVSYQLDGDFAGTLPVDVEVLPEQLRMLVSPLVAQRLGFVLPEG
jgi:diacylglycerol kinase family enzyme